MTIGQSDDVPLPFPSQFNRLKGARAVVLEGHKLWVAEPKKMSTSHVISPYYALVWSYRRFYLFLELEEKNSICFNKVFILYVYLHSREISACPKSSTTSCGYTART